MLQSRFRSFTEQKMRGTIDDNFAKKEYAQILEALIHYAREAGILTGDRPGGSTNNSEGFMSKIHDLARLTRRTDYKEEVKILLESATKHFNAKGTNPNYDRNDNILNSLKKWYAEIVGKIEGANAAQEDAVITKVNGLLDKGDKNSLLLAIHELRLLDVGNDLLDRQEYRLNSQGYDDRHKFQVIIALQGLVDGL